MKINENPQQRGSEASHAALFSVSWAKRVDLYLCVIQRSTDKPFSNHNQRARVPN